MRLPITFAICICLFALNSVASAATMYKCIDANGKISYSDIECQGASKQAKAIAVAAPAPTAEREARIKAEAAHLKEANLAFNQRRGEQDRKDAEQAQRNRMNSFYRKPSAPPVEQVIAAERLKLQEELGKKRQAEACMKWNHTINC